MTRVNFTVCKNKYIANTTLQDWYHWNGTTKGISPNSTTQISLAGCRALCGTGNDYYEWADASSTITTWVLPVIGMLLQAPFESNAFWHTVLAIARWVGSPMASLSYILWNMKVSGKCALMVDMATSYDMPIPGPISDFSSIRDSFYILMTMNQFTMRRSQALNKEAEGLLRIVLFSKDLRLKGKDKNGKTLNERRQALAQKFRAGRKRGVVPVYISTMWFLFSLALSIQTAFGNIGGNATAHDLALGLLMAWLPVLILCSIVDRNPVAADDIRQKLNKLVQSVCDALQDDNIRNEFIQTFRGHKEADRLEALVRNIHLQSEIISGGDFFVDFAGQGRVRWHYGAAHPILHDIEGIWVAAHGRGWLDKDEKDARMHLVLGSPEKGLLWFDIRGLWQVTSAVFIVGGTCLGAFILSYFTPTVGLGCRSGGYMVYCTVAFSLLVAEFVVWWITSPVLPKQPQWVRRSIGNIQRQPTFVRMEHSWRGLGHALESLFIRLTLHMLKALPLQCSAKERHLRDKLDQAKGWSFQKWAAVLFFRPLELCNTGWLLYTVLAQTFGIFRNCKCMTSYWGGEGGYLDFNQSDVTNNKWVKWYWSAGTGIGASTMLIGMIYVVSEWCLQSHINTTNYTAAARGLRRTRRYRRLTTPFRASSRAAVNLTTFVLTPLYKLLHLSASPKQTLLWTRNPPPSPRTRPRYRAFGSAAPSAPAPQLGATPLIHLRDIHGFAIDFEAPLARAGLSGLGGAESGSLSARGGSTLTVSGPADGLIAGRDRGGSDASAREPLIRETLLAPGVVVVHDWASGGAGSALGTPRRLSAESAERGEDVPAGRAGGAESGEEGEGMRGMGARLGTDKGVRDDGGDADATAERDGGRGAETASRLANRAEESRRR